MKGRIFTPEFKLSIVKAVMSGEKSISQLCREPNLGDSLIHNWRKLYREKGEAAFTAPTNARSVSAEEVEVTGLQKRIAELEGFIGQQAVELAVLKKVQELNSTQSKNGAK